MTDAPEKPGINGSHDVRPLVARRTSSIGPWIFGAVALIGATALFATLDANRRNITAPATRPSAADLGSGSSRIADLQLPADYAPELPPYVYGNTSPVLPQPMPVYASVTQSPSQPRGTPDFVQPPMSAAALPANAMPSFQTAGPSVVYDNGTAPASQEGKDAARGNDTVTKGPERVRAGRLLNPSDTIVQGAIIQAVLETALDSTRPGMARAIVSRDIRGFDGVRILVPRGSRLVGEYQSDLSPGQNRALVVWTRLIRPDGVTINLQSPAADELGRAGVRGKVNTHFFERFGGAILQSALDLGVGVATRSVIGGTVIVGLPGSSTTVPQINPDNRQVRPTVAVKQGASVSVFVARDLDFSSVDGER